MSDTKSDLAHRHLWELVESLQVGARLPSERDLAATWGLARMTVRKAMDVLVADGRLDRQHGSGTYVAEPPYAKMLGLSSFTEDMRRRGMEPSTEVLEFSVLPADAALAVRLEIDEGDPVARFLRLRKADGEPMTVEETWAPSVLVPDLGPDDLAGSLTTLLSRRYGIVPVQASCRIDPVLPDPDTARHLGIGDADPCLRVRMIYTDNRKRPIFADSGVYRGDRYHLQVLLSQQAFAEHAQAGS